LLFPERLVLRTLPGGKPELIALCGFGALGTPEALGWMGETCGPCHDHEEEQNRPLARSYPLTLDGHRTGLVGVGFSASGKMGVSADNHGDLRFWNPKTMKVRHSPTLNEDDAPLDNPGFACNGRVVAMASYFHGLRWWDMETGDDVAHWDEREAYAFDCLALSPDSRIIAGSNYGTVTFFERAKNKRPKELASMDGNWGCLAFRPDAGELVLGSSTDNLVLTYDMATHRLTEHAGPKESHPQEIAYAPDGRTVAVALGPPITPFDPMSPSFDWTSSQPPPRHRGGVILMELQSEKMTILHEGEPQRAVAFTPDGTTLAAAGSDRVIRFWSLPEGRFLGGLEWHVGPVADLAFSPDGKLLASAGDDALVRLWPWRELLSPLTSA
jgi:WD40 repeat protein